MSIFFMFALPRYLTGRVVLALASVPLMAHAETGWTETIVGRNVVVRDVDTIILNQIPIRLNGVDGPEVTTSQGREARRWMVDYLSGKTLQCALSGRRSHDRYIGICYAAGQDIGAAAIKAGHALDCERFSNGRYRAFETASAREEIQSAEYCEMHADDLHRPSPS